MEKSKDLFIIIKSVMAKDVKDAMRREKEASIVNVYMDEEWKKNKITKSEHMGFK